MIVLQRNKLSGYLLTLDEAKSWLKVDYSADDQLITSLLQAAENMFENYTGLLVKATEVEVEIHKFESRLPFYPATTIDYVKDLEGNDVDYEYSDGVLTVDEAPVVIKYVGETDDAAIKSILLQILALLYYNRGDVGTDIDITKIQGINQYRQKLWV